MPLTHEQEQFIILIDVRAKQILSQTNYNEEAFVALYDVVENLTKIIALSHEHELYALCQKYNGFFRFMKFLEKLALGISKGIYLFNRDKFIPTLH